MLSMIYVAACLPAYLCILEQCLPESCISYMQPKHVGLQSPLLSHRSWAEPPYLSTSHTSLAWAAISTEACTEARMQSLLRRGPLDGS